MCDKELLDLLEDIISEKIRDEEKLSHIGFYTGRVSAFEFIFRIISENREMPY